MKLSLQVAALACTFIFAACLVSCTSGIGGASDATSSEAVEAAKYPPGGRPSRTSTTRTTSTTSTTRTTSTTSTTSVSDTIPTISSPQIPTSDQLTEASSIEVLTTEKPQIAGGLLTSLESFSAMLSNYRREYGEKRTGDPYGAALHSAGIAFADLIDLNGDGEYELIIGYSADAESKDAGRNDIIDVYSFNDGTSTLIFRATPRSTPGQAGAYIYLQRIDGRVYLRTDDYADGVFKMTFYGYDGATVTSFTVSASAEQRDKDKIVFSDYLRNGTKLTAEEFDGYYNGDRVRVDLAKAEKLYRENPDALADFLTERTDDYNTLLARSSDRSEKTAWFDTVAPSKIIAVTK